MIRLAAALLLALTAPRKAPRRWGGFVHLLARRYQNYPAAIRKAARRKRRRRVDVDGQDSAQGTIWAFHWATIGKNKLHGLGLGRGVRIDKLTDDQIGRLRGPQGQVPQTMAQVLELASSLNVEVEVEVKSQWTQAAVTALLRRRKIAAMDARGDLVFKTLAWMGAPAGPVNRLRPIHQAGGTTVLSFTAFGRRRGISKAAAWPVTDYVRGRGKWTA